MKTKILVITGCLILSGLTGQAKVKDARAITGNSLSDFGKYSIEMAETPMILNGEEVKTYELVYENTNRAVQVGVVQEKNCTSFILKTDLFEIEYVCKKNVFGVKKIEKKYAGIGSPENDAVLNRVGYFSQRVITQNPKTETELLGLIACYFPGLINDTYRVKF